MNPSRTITSVVLAVVTAASFACQREPKVDQVPVGADVQLTRHDGVLVEGKLEARTPEQVTIAEPRVTRSVARTDIADIRVKDDARPAPPPREAKFREVRIPASANIRLTLTNSVSSATSRVEESVRAELSEPVNVDGVTVIPAGAIVHGVVSRAEPSAKVKGLASLAIHFESIETEDTKYPIDARFSRTATSTRADDAKKIGIPAAGGAVLGAIIGGKKGAAIGAAAGGGAGTAVVLSTRGDEVELPTGTTLVLDIGRDVDVRVSLQRD